MSYREVIIDGNRMTITEEVAPDGTKYYQVADPGFGPEYTYNPNHDDLSAMPDHVQQGLERVLNN